MNLRKIAAAAGQLRYSSGKVCNRGHVSERYVSTGMCIACLKIRSDDLALTVRAAKTAKNTALSEGMSQYQVFVRRSHQADVSQYCDILRYGSPGVIEECKAFLTLMKETIK